MASLINSQTMVQGAGYAVRAERIVRDLVESSAARAERALAYTRCLFALLVLARFLMIAENSHGSGLQRASIEVPVLLGTALLSLLGVSITVRHPEVVRHLVYASVLLDAVACALTILPGILYPWNAYQGVLSSADVVVMVVLCVSGGLRFSRRAAWLGAASSAALLLGLVGLDRLLNSHLVTYGTAEMVLYAIYFIAATLLGVTLASRGWRLAEQAASYAMQADAARNGLLYALRESHDAGSLLSAARVHAELLRRQLDAKSTEAVGATVEALGSSLALLAAAVTQGRQHAHEAVAATEARELVDLGPTIRLATARVAQRFPSVEFHVRGSEPSIMLIGGARALTSVLFNVLTNACEGDGQRGARVICIDVQEARGWVNLSIVDDGPGFRNTLLQDQTYPSTKPHGAGVGLYIVGRIIAANGGNFIVSNGDPSGAHVNIGLPMQHQ